MRDFSFVSLLLAFCMSAFLLLQPAAADYKEAVALYNQGRFDKAIQELKPDLDNNPDWEFGHRLLGLCYLSLDNNALAVSSLARAVQLKSTAFSTYYGLGQAYFNMQKYDNCISALNLGEPLAAKEKDPDQQRARLYQLRGSAYFRLNKPNEAVGDLTNALRLNQSDWATYSMLGISYYNVGRIDESIQTLEKALSVKPAQSTIVEFLGRAYFKKGVDALAETKYAAAVQLLSKAKDYDPKNGYVYYNLAEAYLFEKDYVQAEKCLDQATGLMPASSHSEVFSRMGLVYEKQKKWELASKAYEKADQLNPSKSLKEAIERVNENRKR